jgi:valyl-tRNA synthetase
MTAGGAGAEAAPKTPADHWILNKLSILTGKQWENLNNFKFSEAYQELYHFVWDDLADWYVEASKSEPNNGLLKYVLENTLVLLHPFAPFITEAVWRQLGHEDLLATRLFPKVEQVDATEAAKFEELKEIIAQARHLIAVTGVKKPTLYYKDSPLLDEEAELIRRLGRLGSVSRAGSTDGLKLIGAQDIWLDIDKSVAQAYAQRLQEQRQDRQESIKRLEQRLANKSYVENAPKELVDETKTSLETEKLLLNSLDKEINSFQKSLS